MVEELTARYSERVTVILPSAQRGHGPRIARLPGVRVIERGGLDERAFQDAGVQDRLFVLATREGLSRVLTRSRRR